MPRLSLYRPTKTNDYKFLDRTIREMFTVGATDLYVHKYLGVGNTGPSQDLTQPQYDTLNPTNIQDLVFLENRDRKYDKDIYRLRGHYNVQNLDFDLSQFGLFLNNDIIFITIHYNDMIDILGRKLMVGDVLELPHLTDYHPLNESIPISLRRYYQITDGNFASEGFTQTWYPHLWRIKCEPLVDSQEFANILSAPIEKDNYLGDWDSSKTYVPGYTVQYGDKIYKPIQDVPAGIPPTDTDYWLLNTADMVWLQTHSYSEGDKVQTGGKVYIALQDVPVGTPITDTTYWALDTGDSLRDIIGRYNQNIAINDAVIAEAAKIVPQTGYDRSQLFVVPTFDNGQPAPPVNIVASNGVGPTPTRGSIQVFTSARFSPAPVIRIAAGAMDKLFKLDSSDFAALKKFMSVSLATAKLAPEKSDTGSGSGQVEGNTVLTINSTSEITGPYGTADNTYSSADQWPDIHLFSTEFVSRGATVIPVQDLFPTNTPDTWYQNPGLMLPEYVTLVDGRRSNVFDFNTMVVDVDIENKTITLNKPVINGIPVGSDINVGADFIGNPITQNIMDYRADADPRFYYIARYTPRSFGYSSGYMFGDGTAPNGIPTGAGITFPGNPNIGDYFLRTDYLPNLLYRWDGNLWIRIAESSRSGVAFDTTVPGQQSQMASFINNDETLTLTDGTVVPSQQPLSTLFKLTPD
jgi:hypothetical protein